MRAIRRRAEAFEYDHDDVNRTIQIRVRLQAGSYVTSLLDHFILTRDAS